MSDENIVEDLGDGNWLIKPTGEIRKCSRSTAYRRAKKALNNPPVTVDEPDPEPLIEQPVTVDEPEPVEIEWDSATGEIPVFDLPTIEEFETGGDEGETLDPFQGEEGENSDEGFLNSFKKAEIIEDDEGNKKVHIGDLLIGDNPLVYGILGSCDHSLYAWAENKYGIELWDKDARKSQRTFFVKILALVAPKTSIQLDPSMMIVVMVGWLYGMPMLKILRQRAKSNISLTIDPYENQEGEYHE